VTGERGWEPQGFMKSMKIGPCMREGARSRPAPAGWRSQMEFVQVRGEKSADDLRKGGKLQPTAADVRRSHSRRRSRGAESSWRMGDEDHGQPRLSGRMATQECQPQPMGSTAYDATGTAKKDGRRVGSMLRQHRPCSSLSFHAAALLYYSPLKRQMFPSSQLECQNTSVLRELHH
jgi:hypothetical protein